MVSYFAHNKASGQVSEGGLAACIRWAVASVEQSKNAVIAIIKSRPGEDARVIAEVDSNGLCWIFDGRYLAKREVTKLTRRAAHGG